ncbi:MAG: acyl carrier protein [Myxococcota bacterium]|jgi:acyl carrier protein
MSDGIVGQVRQTVADIFEIPESEITDESFPDAMESWDSVGHLNLILALEQQFGVTFEEEQIADLVTVDAIVRAVSNPG